jgi:hypothetical protein
MRIPSNVVLERRAAGSGEREKWEECRWEKGRRKGGKEEGGKEKSGKEKSGEGSRQGRK